MGGACDTVITGNSFAEIGQNMRAHVMAMCNNGDAGHIILRERMQNATDEERAKFMVDAEKRFNALPDA